MICDDDGEPDILDVLDNLPDESDDDTAAFWQVGRPAWFAQSACTLETQPLFFPPDELDALERDAAHEAAKQICAVCPVLMVCRTYALDERIDHGVWGGLTEAERKTLRKQQKRNRL